MRRFAFALMAISCFFNQPSSVDADWNSFWNQFHLDYQRNSAWPQPFLKQDQITTRAMVGPMVKKGWQMQNTLSAEHFDTETGNLNPAGVAKLKMILRHSPPAYRTVYLYADYGETMSEQRQMALQNQLAQWIPGDQIPQVVRTNVKPKGVSGTYAGSISDGFQNSMPAPTIGVTSSDEGM